MCFGTRYLESGAQRKVLSLMAYLLRFAASLCLCLLDTLPYSGYPRSSLWQKVADGKMTTDKRYLSYGNKGQNISKL
jgi:hypothetical protein